MHFNKDRELRPGSHEAGSGLNEEETLVIDDRATLTPSQMVEQKLIGWLKTSPLLVSRVQRQLKPTVR